MATHDPTPTKASPEAATNQPLLKSAEAADLLSISSRKLWSLTASGEIAAVRMGRSVRYTLEALGDFILARSEGGQR